MYTIQSKSDFKSGATLIVRIPEEDLDKTAMYTILSDKPAFILPFHHRSVDGQIEFTYQIGRCSKLTYMSGSRSPREYAELWMNVLEPLFDCTDWFMSPYSFVLQTEYIYCNKNENMINYVYIPSIRHCSAHDSLKNMAAEIAKQNRTTDVNFENKLVWAIQDFSLNEFLQMIKSYETVESHQSSLQSERHFLQAMTDQICPEQPQSQFAPLSAVSAKSAFWGGKLKSSEQAISAQPVPEAAETSNRILKHSGDIVIDLSADGKMRKNKRERGGWFGFRKEPKEAVKKEAKHEPKEKGGLFGKKRPQGTIQMGDVAAQTEQERIHFKESLHVPMMQDTNDVTQLDILETYGAKLRYVGNGGHPRIINVCADENGVFTIGRFDASVRVKQSSFEFDKKTKAISRRHAAIECGADGYGIVDLTSSAGTFINGQKLPPNTLVKLEKGCRVSFGSSGADYVWDI